MPENTSYENTQSPLTGYMGGLTAVIIWASWITMTRYAVIGDFDPVSLNLLRFSVPFFFFLPLFFKHGLIPAGVAPWKFLLLAITPGPAFALSISYGLQYAPAAHMAILTPGTMPLIVALLILVFDKRWPGPLQMTGLCLIIAGVLTLGGSSLLMSEGTVWKGHILFLCASLLWSVYSFMIGKTTFTAYQQAGYISLWGLPVMLVLSLFNGYESFYNAQWPELTLQIILQGVLASIVALIAYGHAVRKLGAQKGTAFTSLVPVLTTLLAIPVLAEFPSIYGWVSVGFLSIGVLLTSGAIGSRQNG